MRLVLPLLMVGALLLGAPGSVFAAVENAVLAGGCFWCLESDLEKLPGVLSVESGYSGGTVARPTYRQVTSETTGHQEVVEVRFDPAKISYPRLLQSYWRNVDPFDGGGQFCDRGDSYRPVIFINSEAQAQSARASRAAVARELGVPESKLKVEIKPLKTFWPAESYHQNYAKTNTLRYRFYRFSCGRDRRLDEVWGSKARSGGPWSTPAKR
ncbi:peptide-methionine (S)-S-oxide reductase MsrA [Synechococcus sp. W2B2]|uniref:peptide-methionine (S)-S-oxide reductase MsrA n=1 Tax=unclassified Synechococcus TaxID=2626047 RepID=UPI00006BB1A7|nr:peptide-methionine (S)-S-oxide reductase MsrA [Synechococcus sp. WH 7805]EAR19818.1 peptide methionine sulfoxide reductase [Synechococcus sp. WH 7805]